MTNPVDPIQSATVLARDLENENAFIFPYRQNTLLRVEIVVCLVILLTARTAGIHEFKIFILPFTKEVRHPSIQTLQCFSNKISVLDES